MKTLLALLSLCVTSTTSFAVCNTSITETTPNADFTVNNDGTVTHKKTKLMWKMCSEGQTFSNNSCTGTAIKYEAANALPTAAATFANRNDWRVPNIKELNSIIEYRCMLNTSNTNDSQPAINTAVFPSTPYGFFWTSTKISDRDNAGLWALSAATGGSTDNDSLSTTQQYYVRLVRDAE